MATHRLKMTQGATLQGWDDPSDGAHASRLNPAPGSPLLYWHVRIKKQPASHGFSSCKTVAVPIENDTPLLDAALGGRLFSWSWGELGAGGPPVLTPTGSQTSEVSFKFTELNAGHWLLVSLRPSNGSAAIHIWVEVIG